MKYLCIYFFMQYNNCTLEQFKTTIKTSKTFIPVVSAWKPDQNCRLKIVTKQTVLSTDRVEIRLTVIWGP